MDTGAFGRELRESGESIAQRSQRGDWDWRWWTPGLRGDNCRIREALQGGHRRQNAFSCQPLSTELVFG